MIVHSYVSLPEGNPLDVIRKWGGPKMVVPQNGWLLYGKSQNKMDDLIPAILGNLQMMNKTSSSQRLHPIPQSFHICKNNT